MRNNAVLFIVVHALNILMVSAFLILLHFAPPLERLFYGSMVFRLPIALLLFAPYVAAGKFFSKSPVTDTIALWIVPAILWALLLGIAYFGGGGETFLRGPFRSLWRLPADTLMLPQIAAIRLLRLVPKPAVYAAFCVLPQTAALFVAAVDDLRYQRRKRQRIREKY
ncbi:hypothetical protein QO008_001463 [Peptoniphilus ivorii]|uniref:hypothetical protein n=1 Tax=Aedoeadaptatus ivorii TaxID=54006 RepID=UPI002784181F|nr:hypothetical protein [Peptoniphilus ivorii]MDQ0508990.1 hypothetical protein [Peptoniphilus ivorii]